MVNSASGPSVTDWIQAAGAITFGVAGIAVSLMVARHESFRPALETIIDRRREMIAVRIWNAGSTAGMIARVEIVPQGHDPSNYLPIETEYPGRPQGVKPFMLPEGGVAYLCLRPVDPVYPPGIGVLVTFGNGRTKCIVPENAPDGTTIDTHMQLPSEN